MPTIAACIPNFNDGRTLRKAVEAVLRQSPPPNEILIIDDCSTDNSGEVIDALSQEYDIVRSLFNSSNLGVVKTLNLGIKHLDSDYVHFATADDCVEDGLYETMVPELLIHPNAGLAFGAVEVCHGERKEIYSVPTWDSIHFVCPDKFCKEYLNSVPCFFSLSASVIYRREALLDVGGFLPELQSYADNFAINAIGLKHGVIYTPNICARKAQTPDSYSATTALNRKMFANVINEAYRLMTSDIYSDIFPREYAVDWRRKSLHLCRSYRLLRIFSFVIDKLEQMLRRFGINMEIYRRAKAVLWRFFQVG